MENPNKLKSALLEARPIFIMVFIFAFVVNIFMLITPLYSLQVLDRVIGSRSKETLIYLSLLMLVLYIALTLLQTARSFTLIKLGEWLDKKVSPELFAISIRNSASGKNVGAANNLRDFQAVKGFLTSAGINSFFDAPWSIVYIAVLFIIHPWMGWLSIIGSILILLSALVNAVAIGKGMAESNEFNVRSMNQSEIAARNAEVVEAMGMMKSVVKNWSFFNEKALEHQSVASYRNGVISNFSRYIIRMVLQMLVTGLGAYLVITRPNEMSTGGMIASSIILGRALSPFDSAIEVWKQLTSAIKSYERVNKAFAVNEERHESIDLPAPSGRISVENLYFSRQSVMTKGKPNNQQQTEVLKNLNFEINSGDIIAVVGPSASGKSTLAKLLVGVWQPTQGTVRLDGADVFSWNRENFGKYVGYLPQDIELFSGSIKDNIAKMNKDANAEDIIKASQMAGAHDLIVRLPNGYETDIGVGGANLSGGQRQRLGLARAFYGDLKLIVLDEPNANLDTVGEAALVNAVSNARQKGITVIIISHRPSILKSVNKILYISEGKVALYGKRDEVLEQIDLLTKAKTTGDN